MLKEERQKFILEKLSSSQRVNFVELEKHLNVSYDSIRRDVIELEDKGLLKKVHGGIVANSYFQALSQSKTAFQGSKELEIIVKKAVKLVRQNETLIMDGGITNFHIARHLPKNLQATIITNSPSLAITLNDHPNIDVIVLGGRYFKKYQITFGGETIAQMETIYADTYFMGVNGVDIEKGLTVRNHEEAQLKKKMLQRSSRSISCCIDEKINNAETFQVGGIKVLNTLVTNLSTKDALLLPFQKLGLHII